MVLSTHKKVTSILALGLTAALLFGSTFAWQSLNQEALNYVKGGANPGGRLHDDFNNVSFETNADGTPKYATKTYNKDVYVENFTSAADDGVNIYARVRLDEYMEIGPGAGSAGGHAISLVTGAILGDKSTWSTHKPDDASNPFLQYWDWDTGGQTTYMPTFNKNKDSLAADINGTFGAAFADYVDYTDETNASKKAYAIYDADENTNDELASSDDVTALINSGTIPDGATDAVRVALETHAATKTPDAEVITMGQWLARDTDEKTGSFWVWDDDGWAYWASPIQPGTATGLLLDQIQRTATSIGTEGTEWYYGINVVAQFITADDLGSSETGTGFYNDTKGTPPSENALALLRAIDVDVDGSGMTTLALLNAESDSTPVSDEDELRAALELNGDVILMEDIALTSTVFVEDSAFVYLNGCDITAAPGFSGQALFTVNGKNACLDFDGHGTVQAPADGCAVQVSGGGLLYIWDGTFVGGTDVIYAENGDVVIVDGTFYLRDDDAGQVLSWSSGSEIIIYGGEFYHFDPSNVNGTSLLSDGYTVEAASYGGDTVYTVVVDAEDEWPELPDEQPEDVLPDDEPEADQPETGTETAGPVEDESPEEGTDSAPAGDDTVAGEPVETEDPGESPADPAPDAAPTPDSSAVESTGAGAVSGISGKAETVEPAAPDAGSAADGPHDSGDEAAAPVEE